MSQRGSLALMSRSRRGLVLFWTAILIMTLAFQYAAAASPGSALAAVEGCDSFAIYTTDVNGDAVNANEMQITSIAAKLRSLIIASSHAC